MSRKDSFWHDLFIVGKLLYRIKNVCGINSKIKTMLKTIFQGYLAFDNVSSFHKLKQMYDHKAGTLYKGEILFSSDIIFIEEKNMVEIPRTVTTTTDKFWQKTVELLKYAGQFAVAGRIGAWVVENGIAVHEVNIEPAGEKTVVLRYKNGVKEVKSADYEAAVLSFECTLSEFDRHADAYSRKAFCLKHLGRFEEAEENYKKSLSIDNFHPQASFGLGIMLQDLGRLGEAVRYYDIAIPRSLPVQPIYWEAKREKAKSLIELGEKQKAITEYKHLTTKIFKETDPNYEKRGEDAINYTLLLHETSDFSTSISVLDRVIDTKNADLPQEILANIFYLRGTARMNLNLKGYKADIEKAETLGYMVS